MPGGFAGGAHEGSGAEVHVDQPLGNGVGLAQIKGPSGEAACSVKSSMTDVLHEDIVPHGKQFAVGGCGELDLMTVVGRAPTGPNIWSPSSVSFTVGCGVLPRRWLNSAMGMERLPLAPERVLAQSAQGNVHVRGVGRDAGFPRQ